MFISLQCLVLEIQFTIILLHSLFITKKKSTMKTIIEKAQQELDERIAEYYSRNDDGGNCEEIYQIAYRVARKYGLEQVEGVLNF